MAEKRRQRSYHFVGQLFSRVPALARLWGRRFGAIETETAATPFTPLTKPLRSCRVALITSGGVHLREQPPFDMIDPRGDPSFRAIPPDTPRDALTITHDYYNHSDADRDLNILYPLELFRELAWRGVFASLATGYGFMGHIEPPHVETLLRTTAPAVAGKLKQEQVDCVLLTPA
jgi:D-proline reductase (dithiol) PrdB